MIKYRFWSDNKRSDLDITSVNYLLRLLTTKPIRVKKIAELNKVSENSRLLLAETDEGNIIGMATLAIIRVPTGRFGRIEDVVVHDKYRRKGIGKTLTERLIDEAKKIGLKRIDLTSNPKRVSANLLYKNLGFKSIETNLYRLSLEGDRK